MIPIRNLSFLDKKENFINQGKIQILSVSPSPAKGTSTKEEQNNKSEWIVSEK